MGEVSVDVRSFGEAAERQFILRTPRSRELWEKAVGVLPAGVSGLAKYFAPHPVFLVSGDGAKAVDVDRNEYVDLLMGAGPLLLGHNHPHVTEAIRVQASRLVNPLMPTELSLEYAERIRRHMPYLQRLRFTNTGSEATRTALRVARAVTGRMRFAKCEGGFHGSDDAFLVSTHTRQLLGDDERPEPILDYAGLSPRLTEEAVILPFNDAEATSALLEEYAGELAAVILEPVAFSSGGGIPATREFARTVRDVTERHGIVLIFDEVVCAFRLGLGGAPHYLGVEPDLSAIGKAIGGGLPLAAVGGRADLMEATLGATAGEKRVFQSGTFTENPLSIAAGMAALDVLENEPALKRANAAGEKLREGLQRLLALYEVSAVVTGVASILQVHLGAERVVNRRDVVRSDLEATRCFLLSLVAEGVLWPPVHPGVTSAAHTGEHVEAVLAAAESILRRLR